MATRPHERRSIWRVGPESTWTTVLPVAFIIASLISLVILPIVVAKHTARMRDEITSLAEPARRTANEVQMDVASRSTPSSPSRSPGSDSTVTSSCA